MDVRTVAQPNAPTVYVKQDVVGAWIIIDIQLYVSRQPTGERGCPRKHPRFGLFCWTVGWWEVFSRVARI